MQDRTIRQSMKTVWLAYVVVFFIIVVGVWVYYTYGQAEDYPKWLMAIPAVLLLFPIRMHLRRMLVKLKLQDDHLTVESGFFSRTRRTLDLAKVQDVTVRQRLGQRILGVGDLMLETAGEAGALGIQNLDDPRALADEIIAGSKRSSGARNQGV